MYSSTQGNRDGCFSVRTNINADYQFGVFLLIDALFSLR